MIFNISSISFSEASGMVSLGTSVREGSTNTSLLRVSTYTVAGITIGVTVGAATRVAIGVITGVTT